jgi:hypothetical protein
VCGSLGEIINKSIVQLLEITSGSVEESKRKKIWSAEDFLLSTCSKEWESEANYLVLIRFVVVATIIICNIVRLHFD